MIVGAVLCGGRSTRMGTDKALLAIDGVPMARRVADALLAGGCDIVGAIGGDDAALAPLGLAVQPDRWPGEGPMAGVRLALDTWPDADAIVVVACDLPDLTGTTVAALLDALASRPHAAAAAAVTDRIQPLCVAWRPSASATVERVFASGERRLHVLLAELPIVEVSADRQDLRNVNAPGDLGTSL
jgi:molybdopterin-guanine dinucleotide biosynthesis protein A